MALDFGQAVESLADDYGISADKHSSLDVKLFSFDFQIMCSGIASPNSHHNQTENRFCKCVT